MSTVAQEVLRRVSARINERAERDGDADIGMDAPRWCEPALCQGWDVARHLAQRVIELEHSTEKAQPGESEHMFRVIAAGTLPDALRCADMLADARKDHEANAGGVG